LEASYARAKADYFGHDNAADYFDRQPAGRNSFRDKELREVYFGKRGARMGLPIELLAIGQSCAVGRLLP
jgi:hypothetical protein